MRTERTIVCFLFTVALIEGWASPATQDYDTEIRQVAERPEIVRAFRAIVDLEQRTLADQVELTEIAAPPFMEGIRALRYAELLREAGAMSVEIDDAGNVVARRPGTEGRQIVAVAAHLDTVFPEGTDVTVRREGNRLLAPGVADDARGLTVVLTLLRAMNEAAVETRGDVLFIGTVGEEGLGDLRGVKHLFREGGPGIDSWIAIDGSGAGGVTNQGIGSHRYRVTYEGPGGHSWGAFGLANPAHALARAIRAFDDEAAKFVAAGPRTSYNIGRIGGGTSVNSIPHEAWLEVDMRSVSPERLAGIDAIFRDAVAKALAEQNVMRLDGDPLTVDVEMVGNRPSGTTDPASPIVQRAIAATRLFGVEPRLGASSTDSNVPIALGLPAITIGGGGEGQGAHSLREWWANVDGYIGIQRALLILAAEAGPAEE